MWKVMDIKSVDEMDERVLVEFVDQGHRKYSWWDLRKMSFVNARFVACLASCKRLPAIVHIVYGIS
jgi:hypothetical protein